MYYWLSIINRRIFVLILSILWSFLSYHSATCMGDKNLTQYWFLVTTVRNLWSLMKLTLLWRPLQLFFLCFYSFFFTPHISSNIKMFLWYRILCSPLRQYQNHKGHRHKTVTLHPTSFHVTKSHIFSIYIAEISKHRSCFCLSFRWGGTLAMLSETFLETQIYLLMARLGRKKFSHLLQSFSWAVRISRFVVKAFQHLFFFVKGTLIFPWNSVQRQIK